MTVEFVCVGTEILLGNIVNTNAAYLAEQCAMLGLSCYHQSVVGDNEEPSGGIPFGYRDTQRRPWANQRRPDKRSDGKSVRHGTGGRPTFQIPH